MLFKRLALLVFLALCFGLVSERASPQTFAQQSFADSSTTFYKYLIIVPDNHSWINTLQPFIEWKTREGMHHFNDFPENCLPVKVTNLTEIANLYGSASASNIRRYIIAFWKNNSYGTGLSTLKYVLLVGDVKYVPTYLYDVTIESQQLTYATDQYYADFYYPATDEYINPMIDKTDWEAEVYVGRFPVNNAQELGNVINKTVTYEMYGNELQTAQAGWERRILFLGAILDNGYAGSSGTVWKDGAYVAEVIKQNCSDWWTGSLGSIPSPTTLYDTNNNALVWSNGYDYLNNLHNLTSNNVTNQISNIGFSALLSVSHGNVDSLAGRNGQTHNKNSFNAPFFNNSEISSLRNNYTLPFWFVDACNAGAFQADLWKPNDKCLGEELLLADPSSNGGVVGFIGCSNLSWYRFYYGIPQNRPEVLETLSDRLTNLTFCQLYHENSALEYSPSKWSLGAALFEAKRLYNETSWYSNAPNEMHMATCLGFNLLGDPSLQIWPEKPLDSTTFYNITAPSTVKIGENFTVNVRMTASVSGGSYPSFGPRQGAKVSISRTGNESVWCSVNLTDSGGNATFTAPATLGTYNLTVTDHPYLIPFQSQIEVIPPVRDVAITNVTVSETVVDQGLSLAINVTAVNHGERVESFNVTVYANDTFVQTKNVTLLSNESDVMFFLWNTTGFMLGDYIIRAEAEQVPYETDTVNNASTTTYTVSIVPEFPKTQILMLALPLLAVPVALLELRRRRGIRISIYEGRS